MGVDDLGGKGKFVV